jgi:hypothetical protein
MTSYASGGSAVAAQQHAIANAVKAMCAIVQLNTTDFLNLLNRVENPLVVMAPRKFFKITYRYIFGWRGLFFFTKSDTVLELPNTAELIYAKRIWLPSQ